MNIFLLIIIMALVTYMPRALPAVMIDKIKIGKKTEKFLGLIPYTAMASLIFPSVITVDESRFYIGLIGMAVAVALSLIKKMPIAVTVIASVVSVMITYMIIDIIGK